LAGKAALRVTVTDVLNRFALFGGLKAFFQQRSAGVLGLWGFSLVFNVHD
jgi:hypothetical protein